VGLKPRRTVSECKTGHFPSWDVEASDQVKGDWHIPTPKRGSDKLIKGTRERVIYARIASNEDSAIDKRNRLVTCTSEVTMVRTPDCVVLVLSR
jgi:hypothetical protein